MVVYVANKEKGGPFDVAIETRENYDSRNLNYTVAMSRARDLCHKNGGGDIIVWRDGQQSVVHVK